MTPSPRLKNRFIHKYTRADGLTSQNSPGSHSTTLEVGTHISMRRNYPHPELKRLEQQSPTHQPPVRQHGSLQVLQRLMICLQDERLPRTGKPKTSGQPTQSQNTLLLQRRRGIFPASKSELFLSCSTTQAATVVGSFRGG